jgi:hypothetical protein
MAKARLLKEFRKTATRPHTYYIQTNLTQRDKHHAMTYLGPGPPPPLKPRTIGGSPSEILCFLSMNVRMAFITCKRSGTACQTAFRRSDYFSGSLG